MVKKYSIAYLTFCNIGLVLNGIAFFVLLKFKNGFGFTQHFILIQLCFMDMCLSVILEIREWFYVFELDGNNLGILVIRRICRTGFYYITFWLVLDRYLHIKLNIEYAIYFSKRKLVIVSVLIWSVAGLSASLIAIFISNCNILIYACYDLVIIIFSIFVYSYALLLFKKQKKLVRSNQHGKRVFKGTLLSSIIISMFVLLFAIPDIILALIFIENDISVNSQLNLYINISYPIAFWPDALIYIFASPQVRLAFKRKARYYIRSRSRYSTTLELYVIHKDHNTKRQLLNYT